jgi:5-methylcytosine-specific restriction endonuclease McrA
MKDTRTRGATLQKLRKRVFDFYGDECWLCHQGGADTIDHILPLSLGGGDELDNLRPAHGRKSKNCVGNFSRKRPTPQQGKQNIRANESGLIITDEYIERQIGSTTSKVFLWAFKSLDDALEFVRR